MKDPITAPNTIAILQPSLADADALAAKIDRLPEVSRTRDAHELRARAAARKTGDHPGRSRAARTDDRASDADPKASDEDTKTTLNDAATAFEDGK